ncbi:hypothetical protein [Hyphomicrobium sp.]|uniref:hypothetical protein n=1 Tax=Hyphomicrobium sp. TaxID=82 RepID=UPI002D799471|nr:hypothetical protein [Hyphomicrobium sp.]HET6388222.1 hypothetical protein [Hyphomicrobium sp.]
MSKSKIRKNTPPAAASGARTEAEAAAVQRYRQCQNGNTAPSFKPAAGGDVEIDHPDDQVGARLIAESIGSPTPSVFNGLIRQLRVNSMDHQADVDVGKLNFALGVVAAVKPRDIFETLLATQMAQVHAAMMDATRRASQAGHHSIRDAEVRATNALARTFTTQLDALKRHRSSGHQRVTVVHQYVHEGGQAIGVTNYGGGCYGGSNQIKGQSHEPDRGTLEPPAERPSLPSPIKADEATLPSAGGEGQEDLPVPRRTGRRTER